MENSKIINPKSIVLIILFVVLAATNPDIKDFRINATQAIQEKVGSNSDTVIDRLGNALAGYAIENITSRDNYFLFSIFKLDASSIRILDPEAKDRLFIGLFNTFFELPTSFSELIGEKD